MALKDLIRNFSVMNLVIGVAVVLVLMQVVAWVFKIFSPDLALSQLRLGNAFLLLLSTIVLYLFFIVLQNGLKLTRSQFLLFVFILGTVFLAYYALPQFIPDIFSAVDYKFMVNSVVGVG
jgi:hypothetical protein